MGKIMSVMARPVKRYNIENRAFKIIGREKPVPAPQYDSTKRQIKLAESINPSFLETHNKKDAGLDDRLKTVYVQSKDGPHVEAEPDPDRPLPTLTRSGDAFEYGYWEPEEAPEGKCSLKTAITFMSDNALDPAKNSVEAIAEKYKLDPKHVANILQYYRVYKIVIPKGYKDMAYVDRSHVPALPERLIY